MNLFPLSGLLLSLIQALGATVRLSPSSLTIVQGDDAIFTCSPSATEWTVMEWILNGRSLLTISNSLGVLPTINPNVTAVKNGNSWQLVLKNTQRDAEGEVVCDLQQIAFSRANLFVQEKGSVTVSGDNKLAFKGQIVLFQCLAAGWYPEPSLQWQVDHKKVNRWEYNISTTLMGSLFISTSNISVKATKSFAVDCLASVSALKTPLKSSAGLTVVAEVLQEEEDKCTVPLAITISLSVLLLLALLCVGTVLCFRHRRQAKPRPQLASRYDQSMIGGSPVGAGMGGKTNFGFNSEGPTVEIIRGIQKMDFSSFNQVPDVVHASSQSLHTESHTTEFEDEESCSNVRRITTV